ncbi:glucose-1-phosphate thymidylyltransferase [Halorubrum aquaticum]|uniref:Bifunctional protein GlmU n=1 Tax=Halorubrum aquaticum TaxID=387340 RepID=A0A1I3ARI8_9EURY|nr:bifunctional sugar-1-phosphate nucleotidylyltransferase/acetyltransferase [Halorubrum aquaticum]SFH52697.1 glucose-1-phosphate thymidylyltransferase [Halorubrum aquaticum]
MSDRPTTAVVLAAGAGRRLSPLTNRRPKPMVPVANKPLLEYVIEAASTAGVDEIVLVVGYERERIQTHFGDGDDWDVSIRYVTQEKRLGTAHAVSQAEPLVDGPFLVLNGDRIVEPSAVEDVREALADGDAAGAMAVTRSDRPRAYGVVTVRDGRVETIVEKPRQGADSEVINAGVYAFTPAVFDAIRDTRPSEEGEYELPDTVERLIDDGGVRAVRYDGGWHDVSYLWDLLAVTDDVLDRDGGAVEGTLAPGAGVDDRCVVASTASVGRGAVVGAGTTVGENARIESNATVERSVVFPDATVEAGAVVRDCIVGAGADVGANATVRGGTATVAVAGELYEGVRLGAVVGDDATVGGAAALSPGTVLGNDAVVGDGASVSGRIEDGVTVRRG